MSNISKELQETINGYKNEAVVSVNRFEHLINELCGQIINKDYKLSDLSVTKLILEGKIKELEKENDELYKDRNEWGSKNISMGKHIHNLERDSKVIIELENTIFNERANYDQLLILLSKKDAEIEALKERVNNLEGLAKKMFL